MTVGPATVQTDTMTAQSVDEEEGEDEIVVTGARPRGSVVGDIPPENVLTSRDVRATGATNINDLLDALAPQIGSAQGRSDGRPVLLLNGQRISSFREMRDIPTEAIERVEILPEEVALKYGYRADQKVVNIVLRQRFYSTTAQVGAGVATDGGYANDNADVTRFIVQKDGRTTLNLHAEGNGILTESERNIDIAQPQSGTVEDALAARSLLPSKRDIRASSTINRQVLGDVSGTLNTELEHTDGRALIGLGDTLDPGAWPQHQHRYCAYGTDAQRDKSQLALDGDEQWRSGARRHGDPARQPRRRPRSCARDDRIRRRHGDSEWHLFTLPAGDASTTLTLTGSTVHLSSQRELLNDTNAHSLSRTTGEAAINLDLPISRKNRGFSALGNLTVNGNVEIDQLSDFGTLTKLGVGANWSPVDQLNFVGSWTGEEGPPTINQLGDPELVTPGTRIFDFTTGQTVLATVTTGGNPGLQSDKRNVTKFAAYWQPFEKTDLKLRAEYVHQVISNPISNLTVTEHRGGISRPVRSRFFRSTWSASICVR